jgi:hypothetical protein
MDTSKIYSTNSQNVVLLERQRAQTTTIDIFRDGSQLVPTGATYTLFNPSGNKIIDAVAATLEVDGTAKHTLNLNDTHSYSEGYIEEWALTLPDGAVPIIRRTCAVVRRRLYPVVATQDLANYYHSINDFLPVGLTSWQKYIDTSWQTILRRVRGRSGAFPYLVISPDSFFEAHLHLTLSRIFEDLHASVGTTQSHFFEMSQSHYTKYQDEYGAINFVYDSENDGKAEDVNKRTSAQSVIVLNKPPRYGIRRGRRW